MELAYPPFRGAGANNDAEVFVLFFFFFFFFYRRGRARSLASNGKRTSTRSTRGLLRHRVHYDRARLSPFLLPPPYLSTFLRLRQRRSCCQFPRGSLGITERAHEFLAELRRQFYFPPTSIFVPFQFLEVSIVKCTAHARILLLRIYTIYPRALKYTGDIFYSE